ncbi:MAG TPA: GAF domain-containing protein, partial [Anaerolineae bacterium]|nr:GAF domain-containing protein [Anaerolineae bacterium]
MLNGSRLLGTATRRFAAVGAAFGFLFPIVATGLRIVMNHLPLTLDSIFEVQRLDPLLWIIDTAPFFLGVFAAAAGHRQDALQQANNQLRALSRELQLSTADRERELAERTAQLGVSLEVGRAITSILDPDDLFRQVAQLLVARFNYYYAAVFVLDDEGGHAVLREAAGPADAVELLRQSGHRLKIDGQSMVGASVVGKAPRAANRVQDDPVWFAHPALPETRSEIALPLMVGGRVLGALDVHSRQVNAFDDSTVAMLQGLADQIAVALNNAGQFQSAQIEARQSTALFEASRLAGFVDDDLPAAANNLLASVSRPAGFDSWLAVTVDAATDTYTVLASHAALADGSLPLAGQAVPAAQVAGMPFAQAIRLRKPIVVEDPQADPRLAGLPPSVRQVLANTVSAPAMLGERVVGAVSLGHSRDTAAITPHDVRLAQAIANQLAVTIHNRRLFDQAQATADELSALMRRYTHEGWARFEQARGGAIRHEYSQTGADPLAPEVLQQVEQAVRSPDALTGPIRFDGQAVVGIPVALRGEVIGTLGIQADKDRRWSPDELVTLKAVADQVAQSIEVARLLNETETSLQETTELYRASRAMAASTTPAEVMRTLVITLRDWLRMAQVRVVLFDEEHGYGTIAAEAAPTPGIESARIPMVGNPVYDTLAATRQPLAVEDRALPAPPGSPEGGPVAQAQVSGAEGAAAAAKPAAA